MAYGAAAADMEDAWQEWLQNNNENQQLDIDSIIKGAKPTSVSKQKEGAGKRKTKRRTLLPRLRKISYKNKKHKYRLKDPFSKRKKAIHEGVKMESKMKGRTTKKAAIAKKGRFNVLRIYRKNKKVKECKIITHDMRYMDKKYGLGKTRNICGQKGGNGEEKVPTPSFRDLVRQTIVNNWEQISSDTEISNHRTMENMINTFANQPRDTQLRMMRAYDERNRTHIFQHLYEMPVESQKINEVYSAQKEMNGGKRRKKTRKKRKTKKRRKKRKSRKKRR